MFEDYITLVIPSHILATQREKNVGGRRLNIEGTKLSPQELRVARLAARGLTNKEIAHALNLKRRTVIYYLEHIFAKKNINSRVLLASVLDEEIENDELEQSDNGTNTAHTTY